MKEFKIEIPKGYEIDEENSTFEIIKFKEKQLPFDYKSIQTIEDAYKRNGKNFSKLISQDKHIEAYIDLCEIAKAINNDDDIDNYEKYWYPYFRIHARSGNSTNANGGVSSLNASYVFSLTATYNGSRLAFNSKEKAEYAAKQFIHVYNAYILGIE